MLTRRSFIKGILGTGMALSYAKAASATMTEDIIEDDEPLFPIFSNGKAGFIDKTGEVAIKPAFDAVLPFSDGLSKVWEGDYVGYIDKSGRTVINPQFEHGEDFIGGFAEVKFHDGCWGFIDKTGKIVDAPQYGYARKVYYKRVTREFENSYFFPGTIVRSGWVGSDDFENFRDFQEGLAAVKKDGKWGFINKAWDIVVEPEFEMVADFSEGLARVIVNGRVGFINRKGDIAIKPTFVAAHNFMNGLACVAETYDYGFFESFGYIDKAGKWIWKPGVS